MSSARRVLSSTPEVVEADDVAPACKMLTNARQVLAEKEDEASVASAKYQTSEVA